MAQSFNIYFEESIKKNWELPALSDFKGVAYHYKDIARKIEKRANNKKADKRQLQGRSGQKY